MFNGIFRKLFATYLAIIMVVITLLAVTLSQFLEDYFFQQKQQALLNTGRQVNTLLVKYHRQSVTQQELSNGVDLLGSTANARIIILDRQGALPDEAYLRDKLGIRETQIIKTLKQVVVGETITRKRLYSAELKEYVVVVGLPLQGSPDHYGAILLFSPVSEVSAAVSRVYQLIWTITLVAAGVGLVLISVGSKRLSKPLVQLSENARRLADGEPVSDVQVSGQDEIGDLISAFNEMKNQLERTEKMRKELLAGVSHELRTPLTAIRGFVQAMVDGIIPGDEYPKYLTLTLAETNRLTRLTSDLLDLAKMEAGVGQIHKAPMNLVMAGEQVYQSLLNQAQEKQVQLYFQPTQAEIWCLADQDRIKQVIWNLLVNSLTYTPSGGQVTLSIGEQGTEVYLRVADTGIGIPEAEIPLVFNQFHRVDKSRDAAYGGTGLGLAIVKNLIELHNGKIELHSQEGQGTVITVTLPKDQ